jgi:hypothetical protein
VVTLLTPFTVVKRIAEETWQSCRSNH